ncbi:MAG: type II toxin-antitoxin system HipA family toxin [Lachnospiraceae bacterium]|nr:type II toxin-antitoxin system HipA family toxin [Lachnospiraceae bacterium]
MRNLKVYIEIDGKEQKVGVISGNDYNDATFSYDEDYLNSDEAAPISISMPLQEEKFDSSKTRNYFEGLLPEGFSRRAVAEWIKTDEKDYLTILGQLGKECLGAVRIIENEKNDKAAYEKLSLEEVKKLASEGATKSTQILLKTHLSLTGASGKVGLYYDEENDGWYLPKGDAPSTHIVKQSHVRLDKIVINEQLCTMAAKNVGIDVPKSFIINVGKGRDEDILFATERYDRVMSKTNIGKLARPYRLHQEDFAQALGIAAEQKYEHEKSGYLRQMFDLLRKKSANPIEDQKKMLDIIIFNYLIGNTDSHIKNYSLLYDKSLKYVRLAPAYDMVATRIYGGSSEMSFYYGDEIELEKIKRKSFETLAEEVGLSTKTVLSAFDNIADKLEKAFEDAAKELKNKGFKDVGKMKKNILKTGGYE